MSDFLAELAASYEEKKQPAKGLQTFDDYKQEKYGYATLLPEEHNKLVSEYSNAYAPRFAELSLGKRPKRGASEYDTKASEKIQQFNDALSDLYPAQKKDTFIDKAANYGRTALGGLLGMTGDVAAFITPDNAITTPLKSTAKSLQVGVTKSAQIEAQRNDAYRRSLDTELDQADNLPLLGQAMAYAKYAYKQASSITGMEVAGAAASSVPTLLGGLIGGPVGAAAGRALGVTSKVGGLRNEVADRVEQDAIKAGFNPEEARKKGIEAAGSIPLEQLGMSAALGYVSGGNFGTQRLVASGKQLVAGESKSLLKRIGIAQAEEGLDEGLETWQQKREANRASIIEGLYKGGINDGALGDVTRGVALGALLGTVGGVRKPNSIHITDIQNELSETQKLAPARKKQIGAIVLQNGSNLEALANDEAATGDRALAGLIARNILERNNAASTDTTAATDEPITSTDTGIQSPENGNAVYAATEPNGTDRIDGSNPEATIEQANQLASAADKYFDDPAAETTTESAAIEPTGAIAEPTIANAEPSAAREPDNQGTASPAQEPNLNGTNLRFEPASQGQPSEASTGIDGQLTQGEPNSIGNLAITDNTAGENQSGQSIGDHQRSADPVATTDSENETAGALKPEKYGKDGKVIGQGGKPFKTRAGAKEAKQRNPMMRIVKVKNGFALAEKTPAQQAAEEKASKRLGIATVGQRGTPMAAHEFIASEGGLTANERPEMGIQGNVRIGNRSLFAGAGRGITIEQATEKLIEAGYAQSDDHNSIRDLIKRSLTNPQYTADGFESMTQREAETRFEDYLAAQQDMATDENYDPFTDTNNAALDDFTPSDLEVSGYKQAEQSLKIEVAALAAQIDALGYNSDDIINEASANSNAANQQEFYAELKPILENFISRVTSEAQQRGDSATGQNADSQASARGQGEASPERLAPSQPAPSVQEGNANQQTGRFNTSNEGINQALNNLDAAIEAPISEVLTAPTREQVLEQQSLNQRADEIATQQQAIRENQHQPLVQQTPPDQRRDTTNEMFGRELAQEQVNRRNAQVKAPTDTDTKPMFSQRAAGSTWYSALEKSVSALVVKSQPVEGWLSQIQGLVKNGKVKADEVEWTGLTDWLKLQTGKVTKEQVMDYLNGNGVQVTETMLGKGNDDLEIVRHGSEDYDVVDSDGNVVERGFMARQSAQEFINKESTGDTKYSQYQLAGGENYREVLLTLPEAKHSAQPKGEVVEDGKDKDYPFAIMVEGKEVNRSKTGGEVAQDILKEEIERVAGKVKRDNNYKSSHWDQKNVLAHIRLNDRISFDKPRSRIEATDDVLPAKIRSQLPLDVVQGGVLAAAHNNHIRKAVISALPIDVVNTLRSEKASPEDLFGNDSVRLSLLTSADGGFKILSSFISALRQTEASIGAKIRNSLVTGLDENILPALRTSDFEPSVIRRFLSSSRGDKSREPSFLNTQFGSATSRATLTESRSSSAKDSIADGALISRHEAIIAHRDRTDADGNKVLFVEEAQSDWGQDGKKRGFNVKGSAKAEQRDGVWGVATSDGNFVSIRTEAQASALASQMRNDYKDANVPLAPFVTNTDKWLTLALKRIVKIAVDEGYDKVAFINGEQSADRYDLSKSVDSIAWHPDTNELVATKDGSDVITKTVKREELADTIGKEAAQKLIDSQARTENGANLIEGDSLKVGGEGMKAFYDKIVPSAAKELVRKLGGGQIEKTDIGHGDQSAFAITDKMRELAREGLPLFSETKAKTGNTVANITKALDAAMGKGATANMKQLHVVESFKSLPKIAKESQSDNADGTAQAFYDPKTGDITLIADRIAKGTEVAVFFHEVGHKNLQKAIGTVGMKRLRMAVDKWKDSPVGSNERRVWEAANQRATKSNEYDAEIITYAIEEAQNLGIEPDAKGGTIAKWLAMVRDMFSRALAKIMNGKVPELTTSDLLAIAKGAAAIELESATQKSQDQAYLAAIESGDMEAVQRMVDEAAKAAGYVDAAYHGTSAEPFTVFNTNPKSENGGWMATEGTGAFFSSNKDNAKTYGKTNRYFLNLGDDAATFNFEGRNWNQSPMEYVAYDFNGLEIGQYETKAEAEKAAGEGGNVIDYPLRMGEGNQVEVDFESEDGRPNTTNDLAQQARELGYTSFTAKSVKDTRGGYDKPQDTIVIFNPEQIKLADPITYDDNGKIIPLSKRFDSSNEDIRYSQNFTLDDIKKIAKTGKMPSDKLSRQDVNDWVVTKFTDSTRPVDVWARDLADQGMAAGLVRSKNLAQGREADYQKQVMTSFGNDVSKAIGEIVKHYKSKGKKATFEAAMNTAGRWLSAVYAPEANEHLMRGDMAKLKAAIEAADADLTTATKAEVTRLKNIMNKRIEEIQNPKVLDPLLKENEGQFDVGVAGGYNNATADDLRKMFENEIPKALLEAVAKPVYAMNKWNLDQALENGKVTPEIVANFPKSPRYVPLTGDPRSDDTGTDVFGTGSVNQGKDKSLQGRTSSLAQDGVTASFEQSAKAARYHGWADFKDALNNGYEKALSEAQAEGMTVDKAKKHIKDTLGITRSPETMQRPSDQVILYRKGQTAWAYDINNKGAMDALRQLNKDQTPAFLKPVAAVTRTMARLVTQYLPGFPIINMVRDTWEKSENIRTRVLAQYPSLDMNKVARRMIAIAANPMLAKSLAPIVAEGTPLEGTLKIDPANKDTEMLREFLEQGGASTWGDYLASDSKDLSQKLSDQLKLTTKAHQVLDVCNNSLELVSSFSAYKAMREQGVDAKTAAETSLELMNFRKGGTIMQPIKALYMFAQPIATGGHQLIKTLSTRRGQVRFAAYMLAGMALYAMLRSGEDDDETGINKLDETSSFILERSIPVGFGEYKVKVPIGFGLPQLAWQYSVNLVKFGLGKQTAGETAGELLVKAPLKTFAPVAPSETSITKQPAIWMMQTFLPQFLKPVGNVAMGVNFAGGSLTNAKWEKQDKAKALQGRTNTPEEYKLIAVEMAKLGWDVYPEQVKEIIHGYAIGALNEVTKAYVDNPAKEARGKEPVSQFVDRWVYKQDDTALKQRLAWRMRDELNQVSVKASLGEELDVKDKAHLRLLEEVKKMEGQARGKKGAATRQFNKSQNQSALDAATKQASDTNEKIDTFLIKRMNIIGAME
jgi:Large polyvalent protein associated domain 38/ADP-Ribosyltransferase in polyvalent proteins